MTKLTPPQVELGWDAIPEGIIFEVKAPRVDKFTCQMPLTSVRELRDDMEEALMLARGYEPQDVLASEVLAEDVIRVGNNSYTIKSVLSERWRTVLQWVNNDGVECEVAIDSQDQITVYRSVE